MQGIADSRRQQRTFLNFLDGIQKYKIPRIFNEVILLITLKVNHSSRYILRSEGYIIQNALWLDLLTTVTLSVPGFQSKLQVFKKFVLNRLNSYPLTNINDDHDMGSRLMSHISVVVIVFMYNKIIKIVEA